MCNRHIKEYTPMLESRRHEKKKATARKGQLMNLKENVCIYIV
jgi:hypothetical protein